MFASSDDIPLSLSLPRPLPASPVCEALQYKDASIEVVRQLRDFVLLLLLVVSAVLLFSSLFSRVFQATTGSIFP